VSSHNLKIGALRLLVYKTSHPKIQPKLSEPQVSKNWNRP